MGVHARGQTIHFDQSPGLELEHLNHQINRLLPDDIRIYNASIAPLGTLKTQYGMLWHATVSSTGKHYSYSFCTNSFVDPLRKRYYAHCWKRMVAILVHSL
jgi:tRNA pseudouridine38-40 synthase